MLEATAVAVKTVLLVASDEPSIQAANEFLSGSPDIRLEVAGSAADLDSALTAHGDDLSAVVYDLELGGDLGRVRDRLPHVPCIGVGGAEDAVRALRAGFADIVARPVDWTALWPRLLDHVATHRRRHAVHAFHDAVQDASRYLHHLEVLATPLAHGPVLRQILTVATLAVEADGGWLFLHEHDGLDPVQAVGFPQPARDDAREGLFHDVYRTRMEKCVGLAGDEDTAGLAPFERDKSTLLAVPLVAEGRALGVLEVARARGRPPFRGEHLALLGQLGRIVAIVLQARRREEHASSLMARTFRRVLAVHEEQRGKPAAEVASALERVAKEAVAAGAASADPADAETAELASSLVKLRALGGGHLRFWRETLDRYLRDVAKS